MLEAIVVNGKLVFWPFGMAAQYVDLSSQVCRLASNVHLLFHKRHIYKKIHDPCGSMLRK